MGPKNAKFRLWTTFERQMKVWHFASGVIIAYLAIFGYACLFLAQLVKHLMLHKMRRRNLFVLR